MKNNSSMHLFDGSIFFFSFICFIFQFFIFILDFFHYLMCTQFYLFVDNATVAHQKFFIFLFFFSNKMTKQCYSQLKDHSINPVYNFFLCYSNLFHLIFFRANTVFLLFLNLKKKKQKNNSNVDIIWMYDSKDVCEINMVIIWILEELKKAVKIDQFNVILVL